MAVPYPHEFREALVRRLTGPEQESTTELSEETGVHQTTLSRWVREAGGRSSLGGMAKNKKKSSNRTKTTTKPTARRPQDFSPEEKLQVLMEAAALDDDELGAYLRRKGIHEAQLEQWRQAVTEALAKPRTRPKVTPAQKAQKKQIQQLQRELKRKEKALAEAAALLVLKKKVQEIWGDEDESTGGRNDS
jgi:transposase